MKRNKMEKPLKVCSLFLLPVIKLHTNIQVLRVVFKMKGLLFAYTFHSTRFTTPQYILLNSTRSRNGRYVLKNRNELCKWVEEEIPILEPSAFGKNDFNVYMFEVDEFRSDWNTVIQHLIIKNAKFWRDLRMPWILRLTL